MVGLGRLSAGDCPVIGAGKGWRCNQLSLWMAAESRL